MNNRFNIPEDEDKHDKLNVVTIVQAVDMIPDMIRYSKYSGFTCIAQCSCHLDLCYSVDALNHGIINHVGSEENLKNISVSPIEQKNKTFVRSEKYMVDDNGNKKLEWSLLFLIEKKE